MVHTADQRTRLWRLPHWTCMAESGPTNQVENLNFGKGLCSAVDFYGLVMMFMNVTFEEFSY